MRSAAFVAMFGTVVLAATGCGAGDDPDAGSALVTLPAAGLGTIVVLPDSRLALQLNGPDLAEGAGWLTVADGVSAPVAEASLATNSTAANGQQVAATLAIALGLDGGPQPEPGGGWRVGDASTDGSSLGGLTVDGVAGVGNWNYVSERRWSETMSAPCTTMPDMSSPCGEPAVPLVASSTDETAIAGADAVLRALGIDDVEITVVDEDFGTTAIARLIVDGQPTDGWSWNFVVNDGEIVQGFGPNQAPDLMRTVDLVGLDQIVQRVQRSMYGAFPVSMPESETPTGSSTMLTTVALAQTTTVVPPPSDLGASAPTVLPHEIVRVELVHEQVWDVSGRQWLVPSYRLQTTGGLTATAFAIDRSLVEVADVGTSPVPPPLPPLITPPPVTSGPPFPTTTLPPTTLPPTTTTTMYPPPPTTALGPGQTLPPSTSTSLPLDGSTEVALCPGLANPPPDNPDRPFATIPVAPDGAFGDLNRDAWGGETASSIFASVAGLPIGDAAGRVRTMCWTVTIASADQTPTTFTPDMLWNRIVLWERNGVVVEVTFD